MRVLWVSASYFCLLVTMQFSCSLPVLLFFYLNSALTPDAAADVNFTLVKEWTAMGDSYASGIGAGPRITMLDGRCFRHSGAYPFQLNLGIPGPSPRFNFVACSGESFQKILANQFLDSPTTIPQRPAWGRAPHFVTLTMGGNDIGIRDLVLVCIYSIRRVSTGLTCDQIIQRAHNRIQAFSFQRQARNVITTALAKGFQRHSPSFKVFVTGYAQFFNNDTVQCDHVTFKPFYSLFAPEYLTRQRRQALNALARELNLALKTAVLATNIVSPGSVYFVDYDAQFERHRFCDRHEPNPNDPNTWFFSMGTDSQSLESSTTYVSALAQPANHSASFPGSLPSNLKRDISAKAENIYSESLESVDRIRVFHPKIEGHAAIRGVLARTISAVMTPESVDQWR